MSQLSLPWRRGRAQAQEALEASRRDLDRIQSVEPEVRRITATFRRLRRENHFGPDITAYLEGGRAR